MLFLWQLAFAAVAIASPRREHRQAPSGCKSLESRFSGQISYPNSAQYANETGSYWSKSVILHPRCVFTPHTAGDIAAAIPILRSTDTKFAVRGNGHMTVKGAASIDNGVLIVLTRFRQLTIAPNLETASLGPGLTWNEVYEWVQKYNRAIVGGRYAPVGVSGFLLGGGISFHGGEYGWGANSVVNYEMVTAKGEVINANKTSHPDLFWALKGGGSNFGIVTRFDVRTYPSGQIFGGLISYDQSTVGHALAALEAFAEPGGGINNPKAAVLPNIFVDPASGNQTAAIFGFFDGEDGGALKNFTGNASSSTARTRSYADFLAEGAAAGARGDFRGAFHCTSFKASAQTVRLITGTVRASIRGLEPVHGSQVGVSIQPLGKTWFEAAQKSGGDSIDIDPAQGNIIVLNLVIQWSKAEDDQKVAKWSDDILRELRTRAEAVGLYFPFIYLNDAQEGADPFASYGGGRSLPKLRDVKKKYDQYGVFQRLMPGGFKLGR